jgi:hypothetical protein
MKIVNIGCPRRRGRAGAGIRRGQGRRARPAVAPLGRSVPVTRGHPRRAGRRVSPLTRSPEGGAPAAKTAGGVQGMPRRATLAPAARREGAARHVTAPSAGRVGCGGERAAVPDVAGHSRGVPPGPPRRGDVGGVGPPDRADQERRTASLSAPATIPRQASLFSSRRRRRVASISASSRRVISSGRSFRLPIASRSAFMKMKVGAER